jgi:membrane-associated phospholipid phosphatase
MRTTALSVALALSAAACLPAHAQVHARPDHLGDTLQYAVPAAAILLSGLHRDLYGLEEFGATFVVSQGSDELLKRIANSPRPDGTGRGFPSGHTSVVFASAGYVRQRYGWQEALPFYVAAVATAYSRVHTRHHFTKDVIGGAAVGELSSELVMRWMGPREHASLSYDSGGVWLRYARAF